ncbi:MAG TPA: hypothetical protein VFK27_02020, partial [Bacillales bacterium]|nr:hypothetical protein [Bacillales bacterium]
ANGENKPFALFEPESSSLEDGKIGYTKEQRTKAEKSEQSAKFDVALFMPKVGTTKDYLMEIRVFPNEHMIQLVYPHFGILESSSPIKTEKTPDHSSTAHLKNGTGKWLEFAHGGYHLRLRLGNTYIAIDTIDIQKRSMVKQIAESLIDMEKLKE